MNQQRKPRKQCPNCKRWVTTLHEHRESFTCKKK